MTNKARMIDLLEKADGLVNNDRPSLEQMAEYMADKVVTIPCRIGDRVWAIRSYKGHKHPQDGIVSEMFFTPDMHLMIVVRHIARGEWGKEIFASREDAVIAIVGGVNGGLVL